MRKILLFTVVMFAALPSFGDKVERVYVCGNNVYIKLEVGGYVAAFESQVGEKVVDRILSVALTLLSTGNDTGFYSAGTAIASCGIASVRPIMTFGIDTD